MRGTGNVKALNEISAQMHKQIAASFKYLGSSFESPKPPPKPEEQITKLALIAVKNKHVMSEKKTAL